MRNKTQLSLPPQVSTDLCVCVCVHPLHSTWTPPGRPHLFQMNITPFHIKQDLRSVPAVQKFTQQVEATGFSQHHVVFLRTSKLLEETMHYFTIP